MRAGSSGVDDRERVLGYGELFVRRRFDFYEVVSVRARTCYALWMVPELPSWS